MNNICKNYYKCIYNNFGYLRPTIIFYGSNIYNSSSSDLDVCIIVGSITEQEKEDIILKTLKYHRQNNLKIDEEIPHENKLIYTISEIEEMLSVNPFFIDNKYIISDIKKEKQFLSSKEMKIRLLLNILTTDHLTVGYKISEINKYEDRAWEIIMDAVIGFNNLVDFSAENILGLMYKNQYSGAEGELYLGYKKNYKQKEEYLRKQITKYLERRW